MIKFILLGILVLSLTACQKSIITGAAVVALKQAAASSNQISEISIEQPMPEKRLHEMSLFGITCIGDNYRLCGDNRPIMHTNMGAGHGSASGRYGYRTHLETAQDFVFLVDLAGIDKQLPNL